MALLLFWHAAGIPAYFGWDMPEWLFIANEVFLPWRMPTLMFLSGLLLERSLRKPLGAFYLGKVRAILWPYVIWAMVHILTFPGFDGSILSPRSWIATGYLWFIFYLLIYYCVAPFVARLPWWVVLPSFSIGALVFDYSLFQQGCYFAVFFFAGYFLRGAMSWVANASRGWVLSAGAVAVAFTAISLWMTAETDSHYFKYEVIVIPFAMTLVLLSVRGAAWVDARYRGGWPNRSVAWVGRNSIVFYLTHFPVISVVCWAFTSLGLALDLWIVLVNWLVAVAAGVGLVVLGRRAPFAWLFAAPRARSKKAAHEEKLVAQSGGS